LTRSIYAISHAEEIAMQGPDYRILPQVVQ
jgi:hypothetical protein